MIPQFPYSSYCPNSLNSLVPSLQLCYQIPEGKFTKSVLAWFSTGQYWWDCYAFPRECGKCPKFDTFEFLAPAPTLQEIMDDLAKIGEPVVMTLGVCIGKDTEEHSTNSAESAMKLWLKVNSIPSSTPSTPSSQEPQP